MKRCELCGAEVSGELEVCTRCGFVFQMEIRSDVRDDAILSKHSGKSVEKVNRDLRNARAKYTAFLDNMAAKRLSNEELATLLEDALAFLGIPLVMGVEDELRFEESEAELIAQVTKSLHDADSAEGTPVGTPGTYIRLSNALQALGESDRAMALIDKAILLNPRDMDAQLTKAKLLFYGKRYSQARKCLEKVLAVRKDRDAIYLAELIDQLSRD